MWITVGLKVQDCKLLLSNAGRTSCSARIRGQVHALLYRRNFLQVVGAVATPATINPPRPKPLPLIPPSLTRDLETHPT